MAFKAGAGGTGSQNAQYPSLHPALEVESHRTHVSEDLAGRLFKGKVQTALPPLPSRIGEMSGKTGFAGTGGTRNQNAAIAEKAFSSEHLIEPFDAARNPLGRCFMG